MFTSSSDVWIRIARHYLVAFAVAAIFSVIYESCSHGVYSAFMVGLAAWPLVLGFLPAIIASRAGVMEPAPLLRAFLASGVFTLTMGSLVTGVMEIYGSTSDLVLVYWVFGSALMLAAVIAYVALMWQQP